MKESCKQNGFFIGVQRRFQQFLETGRPPWVYLRSQIDMKFGKVHLVLLRDILVPPEYTKGHHETDKSQTTSPTKGHLRFHKGFIWVC